MLTSYSFSMAGRSHIQMGKKCQDNSAVIDISPAWKAVVVADGVGSCKHAEVASRIAVETIEKVLKESFPNNGTDRDYQSLLLVAGHTAANAVDRYCKENDPDHPEDYHTTLAMALYNSKTAYYFSVGDSAIVGLDEDTGKWWSITSPDNDETGGVYTLAWRSHYHVGKAKFHPTCVLALTDGVYNRCFPRAMKGEAFEMDVPMLNFFVSYAFGTNDEDAEADSETQKRNIQKFFASDACKEMVDDLSIAAVINTQTCLDVEDIPFEVDWFQICWNALRETPYDDFVKRKQFEEFVQQHYKDFTEEQVKGFVESYIHPSETDANAGNNQKVKKDAGTSKNSEAAEAK